LPFLFSGRPEIPLLFLAKRLSVLLDAAQEVVRGSSFFCSLPPRLRKLPCGLCAFRRVRFPAMSGAAQGDARSFRQKKYLCTAARCGTPFNLMPHEIFH
jgi:hypothetical protein